ncbi:tetratricopeptide repeat protein,Archaeal ATPase [Leptolyngbyaceae cyanobacterium JSC-12]|nr:tetratricopeptide repeat protein,Archaeal ATPase [Leptolyngbyaceae cyanobacterium JSC-12]
MGAEESLKLVDSLVFNATSEHLSDLRTAVFRGSWEGQTYDEIAERLGYAEAYVKEEGANLFRLLTEILGERVTKTNFRAALERYQTSLNASLPQPALDPNDPTRNGSKSNSTIATPTASEIDPNFIGREAAIAHLNELVAQGNRIILIQGEGGRGKTTLARKYFKTQGFDYYLELWMAAERRNITLVESVVEEWLRRDFNEEPGRDFGINLERLKRKLRSNDQRIGILIDNLESALDKHGKFIKEHRPYVDLLRALSDSSVRSITLITSRERLCESSVNVERYLLEGLDERAWRQFFKNRGLNSESPAIAAMCNAYGGNAKAMKIFSGVILQDFDGDVDAFWQDNNQDLLSEPELKDLVASQFDRLQNSNPEVYQLLCRLGCYRYQDVPHVSIEGLNCLLWDVPRDQRRSVIRTLQDRSLIEMQKGKYWLHPVIREEAIARLRQANTWELTNRAAAEYWMDSVQIVETVDDAIRILEAYYHYLEIQDYERACDVLTDVRNSRWGEGLPLGWLFYRLGLLQQMIAAITGVINNVTPDYRLGALYILLGYIYRLAGSLHQALNCHQEASQIAEQFDLDKLRIAAHFNRGLCLRDLGELEEAIAVFHTVISLAETDDDYQEYITYSLCCLAYLNSRIHNTEEAIQFANRAIAQLNTSTKITFWGKGYSLLFLGATYRNLGRLEDAFHYYQNTILLSEQNDFTQIRAKALHGIAQLHREKQNFETALAHHFEAIHLLDKIGAKCDLAEAYYQLGLTHQRMSDREKSTECLQQALRLFNEIQAPKQAQHVHHLLAGQATSNDSDNI